MYLYDEGALPKVLHSTARSAASNGATKFSMSQECRPLQKSIPNRTPNIQCFGLILGALEFTQPIAT